MNNLSLSVFMPVIISFLISVVFCPILIPFLRKLKFGQTEREEGPQSHLNTDNGWSCDFGKYFADLLNLYWQIYGNSSRFIYDTWFWSDWFSG